MIEGVEVDGGAALLFFYENVDDYTTLRFKGSLLSPQ